jgi:serine/threonine protein phosphatase PrpC
MPFATDRITRVAGRTHNEDACGDLQLGSAGCWVVADGLGGHRGGETAASLAVQAVLASFQSNPEFSQAALEQHLEAAQQAVLKVQKEQPSMAGMRTTIVVLITDSSEALWAHVGDSRLYRLDAGRIAFCTKDHSVVQAMVSAGELSARDIRHHEDRNRLLRAVGNPNGDLRPDILPQGRALYKGTAFLLCTDGFWENVGEPEMEVDLAKADNPRDWLAKMEARLLERSTTDSDNYTALAIFFNSESAPDPPAPKLITEDRDMNGRSTTWETMLALVAVALIALAAAGLGLANLSAIHELKQVQAQTQTQSPVPQQQQPVPIALTQRIERLEQRLDAACKSDSKLKALCDGNTQSANTGASLSTATPQAASDDGTASKSAKKSKKGKKPARSS